MPSQAPKAVTTLPKPVLDRINRYAEEGRVLEASYERDYCRLLAVANWQRPAVILRSSALEFSEMRNAAQTEWTRATRKHRNDVRLVK
jgi:hypothetical protein